MYCTDSFKEYSGLVGKKTTKYQISVPDVRCYPSDSSVVSTEIFKSKFAKRVKFFMSLKEVDEIIGRAFRERKVLMVWIL